MSDVSSGEIYNNRHCAACHGVKEWKSWRIRTSSQNILRANFPNLTDVIMSDDCSIINELPEDEEKDAEKFRCFIPEVSACNVTGLWKQYDAAIDAACLHYIMYHSSNTDWYIMLFTKTYFASYAIKASRIQQTKVVLRVFSQKPKDTLSVP